VKFASPVDRFVIQEGAVSALEILEKIVVPGADQLGVLAADCPHLQNDVTVGVPSQHHFVSFEAIDFPRVRPLNNS
jgi:hypothetical protein